MNFLAHAYVSGDESEILAGNFAGDFIKGRLALQSYPQGIAMGVMLHRAVDEYTDRHEIVRESKVRLRPKYRHYAGVIVDVFYDHFLAARWQHFHHQSLADFSSKVYRTVEGYRKVLPQRFNYMFDYMVRGNWLVGYQTVAGIRNTLTGMASRITHPSGMERAADDLQEHYHLFANEFEAFFPDLTTFAADWLRTSRDQISNR